MQTQVEQGMGTADHLMTLGNWLFFLLGIGPIGEFSPFSLFLGSGPIGGNDLMYHHIPGMLRSLSPSKGLPAGSRALPAGSRALPAGSRARPNWL